MKRKIIYFLGVTILLSCLLGCSKIPKFNTCNDLLTGLSGFEKAGNKDVIYTFKQDGTGTFINGYGIEYDINWLIKGSSLYIYYSDEDINFDKTYGFNCDLENNSFKVSDTNGTATYVKLGTQVFKELKGSKPDKLKGVWYDSSGVSGILLDAKDSSGLGFYNVESKEFYILNSYDWVATDKKLILQNISNGNETEYTYKLVDDVLKLYIDGELKNSYSHNKDDYKVEKD